jgi:pimeloyl-ACP methyl ester carboxylesterase
VIAFAFRILLPVLLLSFTGCSRFSKDSKHEDEIKNETYAYGFRAMHVAWSGDAGKRAILFLHGSPGTFETWNIFLSNKELQKKFQLLAVDRPGYGESERSNSETSLKIQAESALSALKFNRSGLKPMIVGYSYGGAIALKILTLNGSQIGGAVLVSAPADPQTEKAAWYEAIAGSAVVNWLLPSYLKSYFDEANSLNSELVKLEPDLKKINVPVSLDQGDQDSIVASRSEIFLQERLKENVISSRLVPGLNHNVPWDRPDLILEAIDLTEKKIKDRE